MRTLEIGLTLEIVRIVVFLVFLGYSSWSDIKTREVSNRVWLFYAPLGLAFTLIDCLIYGDYNYWLTMGISIALTSILAISLFYLGAFGGADAKAFICIALAFPAPPKITLGSQTAGFHKIFPITAFTNSILLAALSVIYMLLHNLAWRLGKGGKLFEGLENEPFWKKILTVLCGYKVRIEKLREKDFYYPLEDVKEDGGNIKRIIVIFPNDEERGKILARLEHYVGKGIVSGHVWASPGLPMLVFITLGFMVALFLGDLVWLLVNLIFNIIQL